MTDRRESVNGANKEATDSGGDWTSQESDGLDIEKHMTDVQHIVNKGRKT